MKLLRCSTQWPSVVVILAVALAVLGCSQAPPQPPKKDGSGQKVEPPVKPVKPTPKVEEPKTKPEEPKTKPEEPKTKPEEPKTKPEEPKTKPEEPAAKPPVPPGEAKVSAFAPAQDLENQVAAYLKDLDKAVASEEDYKDSTDNILRQANTLIVLALALGLHDQPNKYKESAAAIMKAAGELAAAKDLASAKKGVEAVKAACEGKGEAGSQLKWEKVADLAQLMKQVPLVNTRLKRYTQGTRFKSRAKDTAGYAAVIAAIGHASIVDTSQAKNEEQVKQWQAFCVEMRDTAGAANAGIREGDQDATDAAMQKLAKSCDVCHEVFHPAALGKTDVEEKEK